MMPLLLRLEIRKKGEKGVRLWLPAFLGWILLLLLMVILLPFLLLAALFSWYSGYGRSLLLLFPFIWAIIFQLSGLGVEIETRKEKILMHFK